MKPFFVPGRPISGNLMWGSVGKRRFLTTAARQWERDVYYSCLAAKEWDEVIVRPKITMRFQGSKADADNLIKCVADGLKRALGVDDQYFSVSATVMKAGEPGVWIAITEGYQDERKAASSDSTAALPDGLSA